LSQVQASLHTPQLQTLTIELQNMSFFHCFSRKPNHNFPYTLCRS
jgi:hypothetical protein